MANVAYDWYGHAIGLQFALTEMRNEIGVDTCQEHPRLVTLALDGLQSRVDSLVDAMGKAISEAGGNRSGTENAQGQAGHAGENNEQR